jgi:hypothetical protein
MDEEFLTAVGTELMVIARNRSYMNFHEKNIAFKHSFIRA